jgi:3-isopropylmalate/(R)-2-methylmalate dehydratase small subunit
MKKFGGLVLFIDRDNINTDEIIPAKYLTLIEKSPLKSHLLEDLKLEGYENQRVKLDQYGAVVSRSNFGCGSSREAAPWAFEINGINIIIAENFARIFRENAFNCGMLAVELDKKNINELFDKFGERDDVQLQIDLEKFKLKFSAGKIEFEISFKLDKLQKDLVKYGGWVELAAKKY